MPVVGMGIIAGVGMVELRKVIGMACCGVKVGHGGSVVDVDGVDGIGFPPAAGRPLNLVCLMRAGARRMHGGGGGGDGGVSVVAFVRFDAAAWPLGSAETRSLPIRAIYGTFEILKPGGRRRNE